MTTPEQPEKIQIQLNPTDTSPARSLYRRKKTPWWQSPGAIVGGVLIVAIFGWVAFQPEAPKKTRTLSITDTSPISIEESALWTYQTPVNGKGVSRDSLRFELTEGPSGVSIDAETGELSWKPTEDQGPGEYKIGVNVTGGKLSADASFAVTVKEADRAPVFDPIPESVVSAGETADLILSARDPDFPSRTVEYALVNSPHSSADLNTSTGRFEWPVPEDQSPGEYRFSVQATEVDGTQRASEVLTVTVTGPAKPADPVALALEQHGVSVSLSEIAPPFSQFAGDGRTLLVNGRRISVFRYPSPTALQQDADSIRNEAETFLGETLAKSENVHVFHRGGELAVYEGKQTQILAALQSHFGAPFASGPFNTDSASLANKTEEEPSSTDPDLKTLRSLYERDRLTTTDAYPVLRKLFADRFARQHDDALKQAWGEDYREMMDWLANRPEIREELFTAVDPEHDRMAEALELFHSLRKEFPEQIEEYAQLAIAVSVVWDEPAGSVVRYDHHSRRTHSTMPTDLLTASEVFEYFVDAESVMQGRARFLPWEFLIWMVNDRTPLVERKWAIQNYLKRRVQIGKCYKDVPYDNEMLRTNSQVCRLDGKDYVLPNIRKFGGVCAMQADFSSRVAKSLGVPAAYVRGESRGGEHHAWVMWVELLNVNRNKIRFSLESYGRYRGDKYYVGTLRHAQTGQQITDRIMERKLRVVGGNPKAKRHADLAVRALELVDQQESLTVKDAMVTLLTFLKLCPGHEPSWRKLAELAGSDEIDREERRMMVRALDSLFQTFRGFPDFTWKIFADLTRYEDDPRKKIQLFERLLKLYQTAGRPDLACEAALKTADLLVKNERAGDAVQQLAAIMLRFADEGRYVPRMLDRMEEIYKSRGGASSDLVAFYQKLIPKIPPKRGNSPSPYAIKMYQRAVDCFKSNNKPDLARAMATKLAALQAGM